ncbi:LysE family translocator [Pelagibius sp.]|uniref:LysE family translocator n=1 Tax=Pelagibius sp. TaxID=1931238 RepID=UPI003B50F49C
MDTAAYLLFLAAAALLALAPGPSTLLVLSHALTGDPRRPLSLILGALLGNLMLIAVTVLGLAALILASQTAFTVLRFAGAAYLIWLGVSYWRAATTLTLPRAASAAPDLRYRALALQAFLTSTTNPKGLLFYFALLPQFAPAGGSLDLLLLGGSYLALFMAALGLYALAGRTLARLFARPGVQRWKNRITGALLVGLGVSLLRAERS